MATFARRPFFRLPVGSEREIAVWKSFFWQLDIVRTQTAQRRLPEVAPNSCESGDGSNRPLSPYLASAWALLSRADPGSSFFLKKRRYRSHYLMALRVQCQSIGLRGCSFIQRVILNKITNQTDRRAVGTSASQYLTFTLLDQDFGVDVLRVQEIKNFTQVTPIPNMPDHIKGVMNLRGTVVPVVDLRKQFNMPPTAYTQFTVIIVVNSGSSVNGLVVDAVTDVLSISADAIEGPPNLGGADISFIQGLAKTGEQIVTLLDIDQLLGNLVSAAIA
jgi:purine-binding chemotaxis protein CheW